MPNGFSNMSASIPRSITLHYFNGRSRGELVRYILYYAKVPFVDKRIERTDWPSLKPDHSKFPLGQVPVLEYVDNDGKQHFMAQSSAIARTCARWCDLAGKTPNEVAEADEVHECIQEVFALTSKVTWEHDVDKKEALIRGANEDLIPRVLSYLERKLTSDKRMFLAGGQSFTYADFALATCLEHASRQVSVRQDVSRPGVVDLKQLALQFPALMSLKSRVEEAPAIKTYLSTRPETSF